MTLCIDCCRLATMGVSCREPLLITLLAVFCCTSLIVLAKEDDSMTAWLKFMAETSGSDADPKYFESPYEDSYVTQPDSHPDGPKQGGSTGMFVRFPKPQGKSRKITVSKSGKDDFTTINAALDSIAEHTKHRTVVHIREGVYE